MNIKDLENNFKLKTKSFFRDYFPKINNDEKKEIFNTYEKAFIEFANKAFETVEAQKDNYLLVSKNISSTIYLVIEQFKQSPEFTGNLATLGALAALMKFYVPRICEYYEESKLNSNKSLNALESIPCGQAHEKPKEMPMCKKEQAQQNVRNLEAKFGLKLDRKMDMPFFENRIRSQAGETKNLKLSPAALRSELASLRQSA